MAYEKVWTKEMDTVVKDASLTAREVADKLGKTETSVKNRRHVLGVKIRKERKMAKLKPNPNPKPIKNKFKTDTVGGRIKMLRTTANISQVELANKIGYTFKSANTVISDYERNVYLPSSEKLEILATVFNVTPDYILNGDKKEEFKEDEVKEVIKEVVAPKMAERMAETIQKHVNEISVSVAPYAAAVATKMLNDPQPVKTALTNSEGYCDPTAMKAIAIMDQEKTPDPIVAKFTPSTGEIYRALNSSTPLLVLKVIGTNVLMTNLLTVCKQENMYFTNIIFNDKVWYINLSRVFTRKITDLTDFEGTVDNTAISSVLRKLKFYLGFQKVETTGEMDPVSTMFVNSVDYFNEKNGTNYKVSPGVITLKEAMEVSASMGIDLSEFLKDHETDKILDEICRLDDEIAEKQELKRQLEIKAGLAS